MDTLSRPSGACNTLRAVSSIFHPLTRTHGGPRSHGFDLDAERRIRWTYSYEPPDPEPADEVRYQLDDLSLQDLHTLRRERRTLRRVLLSVDRPPAWKAIRLQRIERELRGRGAR